MKAAGNPFTLPGQDLSTHAATVSLECPMPDDLQGSLAIPPDSACARPVTGASLDRVRDHGALRPFRDGADRAENLAAHVRALGKVLDRP